MPHAIILKRWNPAHALRLGAVAALSAAGVAAAQAYQAMRAAAWTREAWCGRPLADGAGWLTAFGHCDACWAAFGFAAAALTLAAAARASQRDGALV